MNIFFSDCDNMLASGWIKRIDDEGAIYYLKNFTTNPQSTNQEMSLASDSSKDFYKTTLYPNASTMCRGRS